MKLLVGPQELEKYIDQKIENIQVSQKETKAYIYSVFAGFIRNENIPLNESITLQYIQASENYSFTEFQKLADWIFFVRSSYPGSLRADPKYYDAIAKSSYNKCHIMLNKKLLCFEELCDRFEYFVTTIGNSKDQF